MTNGSKSDEDYGHLLSALMEKWKCSDSLHSPFINTEETIFIFGYFASDEKKPATMYDPARLLEFNPRPSLVMMLH